MSHNNAINSDSEKRRSFVAPYFARLWRAFDKMRAIALFVIYVTLAGCLSYQPDERVVGRFRATTGEVIDIRSDHRILFVTKEKTELVGLVTIDEEEPLSVRVIAPDTSPLVGTAIVFSYEAKRISVKWAEWRNAGPDGDRPTEFRRE